MNFKVLTIKQLEEYIHSSEFKNAEIIPITFHRARSQIKNPRATSENVVLIIAYNDKNEIIGYTGALPDWLLQMVPELRVHE